MSHLRSARPVSAETQDPALCPHTTEHSQPNRGVQLPGSTQPPPSFLRRFRQPLALLKRMLRFFFLRFVWARWLQKEKPGLISSLPELHAALQAFRVRADVVERGFAGRELLTTAHTLCAGSTALPSVFPALAVGTGTRTGRGHKDRDPRGTP